MTTILLESYRNYLTPNLREPYGSPTILDESQKETPILERRMNLPDLILLPQTLAVCRLGAADLIPAWAEEGAFFSVTRSAGELSVVCEEHLVPPDVRCQAGWRCIQVVGPLDFCLVGILSGIAVVLAHAGVSIFAISTYDTDYILLQAAHLPAALAALGNAGYSVRPV